MLVGRIAETLQGALKKVGIDGRVEGREKDVYSIYEKMRRKKISLNEIVDVYGFRLVVDKGSEALLYIDRNLLHDGAFHAFGALVKEGRKVRKPRQSLATADHYVPTSGREKGLANVIDADAREMIRLFDLNGAEHGIRSFGMAL